AAGRTPFRLNFQHAVDARHAKVFQDAGPAGAVEGDSVAFDEEQELARIIAVDHQTLGRHAQPPHSSYGRNVTMATWSRTIKKAWTFSGAPSDIHDATDENRP